jgi:hypothetical protein
MFNVVAKPALKGSRRLFIVTPVGQCKKLIVQLTVEDEGKSKLE